MHNGCVQGSVEVISFWDTRDKQAMNLGDVGNIRFKFRQGFQLLDKNQRILLREGNNIIGYGNILQVHPMGWKPPA